MLRVRTDKELIVREGRKAVRAGPCHQRILGGSDLVRG